MSQIDDMLYNISEKDMQTKVEKLKAEQTDIITDYFKKRSVPLYVNNSATITVNDGKAPFSYIILPGCIVIQRTFCSFRHKKTAKRLASNFNLISAKLPDVKIYVYVLNITPEYKNNMNYFYEQVDLEPNNDVITFVTSPNEIKVKPCIYYFDNCGPIWTLSRNSEVEPFKSLAQPFYVSLNSYYHATTVMSDEEINTFNKYNYRLVKSEEEFLKQYSVIIAKNKHVQLTKYTNPKDVATKFYHKMEYSTNGVRIPVRYVKNYTDYCSNCNRLIYIKLLRSDDKICHLCIKHIQRNE